MAATLDSIKNELNLFGNEMLLLGVRDDAMKLRWRCLLWDGGRGGRSLDVTAVEGGGVRGKCY